MFDAGLGMEGFNRYTYVGNRAASLIDPSGFGADGPDGCPDCGPSWWPPLWGPFPGMRRPKSFHEYWATPRPRIKPAPVAVDVLPEVVSVAAQYQSGLPGISVADASVCAQAQLATGCFSADVRPYGYPFTLYAADADVLYEAMEEYAEAYDHRFDIVKDLTIGWLTPYESDGDVQLAGRGSAFARTARMLALRSVRIGQRGETLVRKAYNIGQKTAIRVAGRDRIPDGMTRTILSEVKNVRYLDYTRQLRDFATYAKRNGLRFDLYVRRSTQLSGPLMDAVRAGIIRLRYIP
jgi:hypothetical protein